MTGSLTHRSVGKVKKQRDQSSKALVSFCSASMRKKALISLAAEPAEAPAFLESL